MFCFFLQTEIWRQILLTDSKTPEKEFFWGEGLCCYYKSHIPSGQMNSCGHAFHYTTSVYQLTFPTSYNQDPNSQKPHQVSSYSLHQLSTMVSEHIKQGKDHIYGPYF